ncbi:DinB family protein [Flavobacterium selenitireducens]|uniref:DinB family protein n=1 Tax=Flavobacterium selenitireducens TaxID=2722704 RepID=UPI00168AEF24|nr:DinB family protein [Flavobacterium selenitireducens]MBD3580980.1 DinB family protein [Flavobacterium selenitireducens]
MENVSQQIEALLREGTRFFMHASEDELSRKPSPDKWSKREILGHLIDSAVHNLVRFTEARCHTQPYRHRPYDQDELVRLNDYQNQETEDLLVLWLSLNKRIAFLIANVGPGDRSIAVVFADGTTKDLEFLMRDYADHLGGHLRQIDSGSGIR